HLRARLLARASLLPYTTLFRSRTEISYLMLGEIAFLMLLAIPLGCGIGWVLAFASLQGFETELYRVPFVIEPSTFGIAISVAVRSEEHTSELQSREKLVCRLLL